MDNSFFEDCLLVCLAIVVVFALFISAFPNASPQEINVEKIEVTAIVTNKECEEATTKLVPYFSVASKTTMMRTQKTPAKYFVTITYEGISITKKSEFLYNSVQVGDPIQMIYTRYYNNEQVITKETLELS